jgi:hypothetical protein
VIEPRHLPRERSDANGPHAIEAVWVAVVVGA